MTPRILVAGIGNIFFGDDAFGVEVVRALALRPLPDAVQVKDFGIRGFDLASALVSGYDATILVDAVPRGGEPGTLYCLEIEPEAHSDESAVDGHSLDPVSVLRLAESLGVPARQLLLVGCEPSPGTPDDDFTEGLSPAVRAAVPEAVAMIESLVGQLLLKSQEVATCLT
ncbi:MAG TPA: hydrogenase maturation protease [Urbifossiella sp.]|nr:hydrogenase maturation protease [Urbifossiella sp.]